jgi:hypothetical protein
MVLMKFRNPYSANDYYKQYNDRPFSSMEVKLDNMYIYVYIYILTPPLTPPLCTH